MGNLFWAAGFGLFYVRLLECVITLVIFWFSDRASIAVLRLVVFLISGSLI